MTYDVFLLRAELSPKLLALLLRALERLPLHDVIATNPAVPAALARSNAIALQSAKNQWLAVYPSPLLLESEVARDYLGMLLSQHLASPAVFVSNSLLDLSLALYHAGELQQESHTAAALGATSEDSERAAEALLSALRSSHRSAALQTLWENGPFLSAEAFVEELSELFAWPTPLLHSMLGLWEEGLIETPIQQGMSISIQTTGEKLYLLGVEPLVLTEELRPIIH